MTIKSVSFFAITLSACGSAPLVVNPPPPQIPIATPCTDEWVHMPVVVNFPTGGADLDTQNRAILQEVVRSATGRSDIRRVRVEGHTDSCGSEGNNMVLSEARAHSVAGDLATMGVPAESIETVGYGSVRPRAPNGCTHQQGGIGESDNRRVEFDLLVCR